MADLKKYYRYPAISIIAAAVLFGLTAMPVQSFFMSSGPFEDCVCRIADGILPAAGSTSGMTTREAATCIDGLLGYAGARLSISAASSEKLKFAALFLKLLRQLQIGPYLPAQFGAAARAALLPILFSIAACAVGFRKLRDLLLQQSVIAE